MGSMFEIWHGDLYAFGPVVYKLDTGGFDTPDRWTWLVLSAGQAAALKREMEAERLADPVALVRLALLWGAAEEGKS